MGSRRNTLGRISAILLLAVLVGLAAPRSARAVADNVPHTMNFDGYLTDTAGAPLTGTKNMKFGLIVDTTRVWYAGYASVSVTGGVFAVVLGDAAQGGISLEPSTGVPQAGTFLPISASVLSTITSASIVTLEVEVYNGATFETLLPAYPVSSALFALKADTVDGYDSTQLAKLDGSGNILSNNGTVVINTSGTWVGPSANIGSGGLTVTAGGAAITGNSNITGTLGVTSSLTAGSITTSGAMNASGKISATAAPTGIGVSNGSFYVNPASATFDNTLFGVAVNGTQKFRVDAEGDTAVGGDLTVTGTLNATVASAGNATTVNGIGASAIATPNMLFPLDGSGKFPASVITSSGLDADTVDTFHASSTATSGYLYPLGIDAKFPNSVLNTGIGSGLNADQVDGFHASSTALSGYLYPLGVGNKFPNSVLNTGIGGGLDADSVDGIHASTAPLANTLLALDGSGKFPSSVLDTAGINAGTLDSLDSTAFGQITASNSWTGTTNTFKEVDIASGSVIKLLDGASGAIYLRNNSGTLQFLENDGATAACTISQTGVLTVAGGLTVSSGTVSLPTGSITGTHVFDRTIASVDIATGAVTANELGADSVTSAKILDNTVAKADINTNAVTADKQITPVYVGGAGANTTAVADCGAGFVAVGGGGSCLNSGGSARSVQESCPSSVNNACTDGAALRYWFLRCSGNGSSTSHQVWAICMKAN